MIQAMPLQENIELDSFSLQLFYLYTFRKVYVVVLWHTAGIRWTQTCAKCNIFLIR